MSQAKVKIDVADLQIGMYVCELDRPWLESPFLFQGFLLEGEENIEEVRKVCEYVYVDPERSHDSVQSKLISQAAGTWTKAQVSPRSFQQQSTVEVDGIDYREHLFLARKIHTQARNFMSDLHGNIRQGGKQVDVKMAKTLVTDLADNIMINPHAMMWLTHLKQRHEYTLTHSINVCILALTFGRHMDLERGQLEILGLGALLHDIGKLRIPTEILDKPGRLTPEEFAVMKTHPVEGYQILKDDKHLPPDALDVVHYHHERISGKGYPDGLTTQQITLLTKMASIVDVYDAITSDRCYHDGISPYKALQNMYGWTKADFDKELIEAFMSCMGVYPVGSIVELNNGQIGIVIATTPKTRLRPIVLLIMDEKRQHYRTRRIFNMSSQVWDRDKKHLEIKHIVEPNELGVSVRKILEAESLSPQ